MRNKEHHVTLPAPKFELNLNSRSTPHFSTRDQHHTIFIGNIYDSWSHPTSEDVSFSTVRLRKNRSAVGSGKIDALIYR